MPGPAAPEEPEPSDVEELEVRKSLRDEAHGLRHRLLHKPGLPKYCDVCMIGKTRQPRRFSGRTRWPDKFGEIVTMDHVDMADKWQRVGIGGFKFNHSIFDIGTGFRYAQPVVSMDSLHTIDSLNHYIGDDVVIKMYCDNWSSYKGTCKYLGVQCEQSLPGIHKHNARIERLNQDLLDGTRSLLLAAGMPSCWWTWAMPYFAIIHNLIMEYDPRHPLVIEK